MPISSRTRSPSKRPTIGPIPRPLCAKFTACCAKAARLGCSSTTTSENVHAHQWRDILKVPVHLLSAAEWATLFAEAGFSEVKHERIPDPTPVPEKYEGRWFRDAAQLRAFREEGALLVSGTKPPRCKLGGRADHKGDFYFGDPASAEPSSRLIRLWACLLSGSKRKAVSASARAGAGFSLLVMNDRAIGPGPCVPRRFRDLAIQQIQRGVLVAGLHQNGGEIHGHEIVVGIIPIAHVKRALHQCSGALIIPNRRLQKAVRFHGVGIVRIDVQRRFELRPGQIDPPFGEVFVRLDLSAFSRCPAPRARQPRKATDCPANPGCAP